MTDVVAVLRQGGIVADPADVIAAAQASGLPLAAMAPKLKRESYGGRNVVGNDRVDDGGQYRKGGNAGDRAMTVRYLRWRGPAGKNRKRQQGWGPSQLTWAELQDDAERRGGLHVPRVNMTVGAESLARHFHRTGNWRDAGALYNGGSVYAKASDDAQDYGRWLEGAVADWERRFSGLAVPAGGQQVGRRRTLRRGDKGGEVAELQGVLAKWYRDLRLVVDGDFGPATENAVRRLQQNTRGLTVDGIAGPQVFGALGMS